MRVRIVVGLFVAALVSSLAFFAISDATVVPLIAKGAGPGGVQVTTSGWFSLLLSGLGAGGFTLAGIVTLVARQFGVSLPTDSSEKRIAEVVEEALSRYAPLPPAALDEVLAVDGGRMDYIGR